MKRITCAAALILALTLLMSLTGCGSKAAVFAPGTVDGQTYTNEFLKLTCTAPEEFSYLSQQELDELNQLTDDEAKSQEQLVQEALDGGSQIYDMYLMTADRQQTSSIVMTKPQTEDGVTLDMAAFADLGKSQAESAYASRGITDVTVSRDTIEFLGQSYEGIRATGMYDGNAPVYGVQFYIPVGDYVCTVTFTSYIEDTTADMMRFFALMVTEAQ